MIDPEKIVIGEKEYLLPALNLGVVRKLPDNFFKSLEDPSSHTAMDTVILLLVQSLKAQYPEINEQFLMENIGFPNQYIDILGVLMSQFAKKKTVTAATAASQSTGASSTQESLPLLAGLGNI